MILLGTITLNFLLTIPFMLIFHFFPSHTFLQEFLFGQSIPIMGTMLAINIPTATFLIAELVKLEKEQNKELFPNTIKEIKHNMILMFILFPIQIVLLAIAPDKNFQYFFVYLWLGLFIFSLYIYALWEMVRSIFQVRYVVVRNLGEKNNK